MPHAPHIAAPAIAAALRLAAVAVRGVQAYARFYFGYWFSHTRA